jgi:peptide/nickel transport system permease protein
VSAAVRRLALVPPTLIGITLVTFLLVHLAPGDPAAVRGAQGRGVSPEAIAAFRQAYGLDGPIVPRYLAWVSRTARLDFGESLVDGRPVREKLGEAFPATAALALLAVLLSYLVAVPLGCALAAADGKGWARVVTGALYVVYALPAAAVALIALAAGAPYGGRGVLGLLVAAACLSLAGLVRLSRYQRGALLAALRADYVRTARAKGASPARVIFGHGLRNALLPTVTLLGAELPALLSGSVIVEQVFGVHGLGLLGFDAVLARDYPVLLGLATLGALLTLAGVLAADAAYGLLDPRLRGNST